MRRLSIALVALALVLPGCGYNDIQALDETVKAAWGEVTERGAATAVDPAFVVAVHLGWQDWPPIPYRRCSRSFS